MGSIQAGDFKKGIKVQIDNEPYEMLECFFVKPGKGQALYRTKLRNLLRGSMYEKTYRNGDSLESADVHRNEGVYSYRDGDSYVFMDNATFEQHSLPAAIVAEDMRWLMEGATVGLLFWNEKLISMTPPQHVVLTVTYTEPAARGAGMTGPMSPFWSVELRFEYNSVVRTTPSRGLGCEDGQMWPSRSAVTSLEQGHMNRAPTLIVLHPMLRC